MIKFKVGLSILSQALPCLETYGRLCFVCPFCVASTFFRSILHDPTVYSEPDSFEPARFLNPDGSLRDDPVLGAVFGFGKRICPGRHIADTTLFIAIASLLSVFNIERGRNGGDKLSDYAFKGCVLR